MCVWAQIEGPAAVAGKRRWGASAAEGSRFRTTLGGGLVDLGPGAPGRAGSVTWMWLESEKGKPGSVSKN